MQSAADRHDDGDDNVMSKGFQKDYIPVSL